MTTFVYVIDVAFSEESLRLRIFGTNSKIRNNIKSNVDITETKTWIRFHHLHFSSKEFLVDFVWHNVSDDL